MSCAHAHRVRVMQLKLPKPTMAIGYSLRMCARHVDSTNPGRSNLVFMSKPIPEAEMSNRLISTPQALHAKSQRFKKSYYCPTAPIASKVNCQEYRPRMKS